MSLACFLKTRKDSQGLCPLNVPPYKTHTCLFLLLEQFIPAHLLSHFTSAQAALEPWLFFRVMGACGCGVERRETKLQLLWCLSCPKHLGLIILYVACSELVFLVAICYGTCQCLKWVLELHSLMYLIIQPWNERYAEVFQKRSCDWNTVVKSWQIEFIKVLRFTFI